MYHFRSVPIRFHQCNSALNSLRFRMGSVVNFDHFFHRNLGVNLGCRETCVAEEFLDVAEIGPLIEEVRGESVPQRMGRDVVDVGALFDVFVDHSSDRTRGDTRSLVVQEYCLRIAHRFGAVF